MRHFVKIISVDSRAHKCSFDAQYYNDKKMFQYIRNFIQVVDFGLNLIKIVVERIWLKKVNRRGEDLGSFALLPWSFNFPPS